MVEAERIEDGCSYYQFPVYDHRGTVHKLVDRSGETLGEYVHNAFGEILDQTNPPEGNRFKYQTNWMALKENLNLSPSRVYSGDLGRFLQKDPLPKVRERGKLGVYENSVFKREMIKNDDATFKNLYSYCDNSTLTFLDIFGLPAGPVSRRGSQRSIPTQSSASPSTRQTLTKKTHFVNRDLYCSDFVWTTYWELSKLVIRRHIIVQHVKWDTTVTDCFGIPVPGHENKDSSFYEAWYVEPVNKIASGEKTDGMHTWEYYQSGLKNDDRFARTKSVLPCTKGRIVITGVAQLYNESVMPSELVRNSVPTAHNLFASYKKPSFKKRPIAGANKKLVATWDCCTKRTKTKLSLS